MGIEVGEQELSAMIAQALPFQTGELALHIGADQTVSISATVRKKDMETVSYTHLDVYKRQVLVICLALQKALLMRRLAMLCLETSIHPTVLQSQSLLYRRMEHILSLIHI